MGTKARLALALLMWTGARRSDVVLLGKQHTYWWANPEAGQREPWLRFVQFKGRERNPVTVEIPLLPELQRIIEESPVGDMTFLVTEHRAPFTSSASFGNWFRDRCIEAGVPGRAHGLRKAGATTAAEQGATAHQLMAIFGWLTLKEAERYTRSARRKRLAGKAIRLLVRKEGS